MTTLLQYVEEAPDERIAQEYFAFLQGQEGYLGGRLLPPGPGKPLWRVQVFFLDDDPSVPNELFPDGVRRVTIPPSLRKRMGLPEVP